MRAKVIGQNQYYADPRNRDPRVSRPAKWSVRNSVDRKMIACIVLKCVYVVCDVGDDNGYDWEREKVKPSAST